MTGRVIAGRYNLQHPIGRGAMGVVWRARDQILDREVAVKEVLISSLLDEEERRNAYQRTKREARTAARLSHRGLVAVYDVVEEDGRPWIVMELVPSRSLDQVLTVEGRLPALRVARIGQQLLSALAAAHHAGVLHRDVKPSNVLIATDKTGTGWDERAVLTDFGIAQFEGDPRLTQTGMVMGSPGFTAPERIRGGDATPASDLWSLGATLYAAVEGRGPYEQRGGAITTMSAIINEDAPIAANAGRLAQVIAALLRREPGDRPAAPTAARMFAQVLSVLTAGEEPRPAAAHPPTVVSMRVAPPAAAAPSASVTPPVESPAIEAPAAAPAIEAPAADADAPQSSPEPAAVTVVATATEAADPLSEAPAEPLPTDAATPGPAAEDPALENAEEPAAAAPAVADDAEAPAVAARTPTVDAQAVADGDDDAIDAAGSAAEEVSAVEAVSAIEAPEPKPSPSFTAAKPGERGPTPTFSAARPATPTSRPAARAAETATPPSGYGPAQPSYGAAQYGSPHSGSAQQSASSYVESGAQQPVGTAPFLDQSIQYRPGSGGGRAQRRTRSGRRIVLVICAVLVAAAIGAGVALALSHHKTAGAGAAPAHHDPVTKFQTVNALNEPSSVVPPGWVSNTLTPPPTDKTSGGFRIDLPPSGWTVQSKGFTTDFHGPDNMFLEIDLTAHIHPNNMVQEAKSIEASSLAKRKFPKYKLAVLTEVPVRGTDGAFWQFTWSMNGVAARTDDILFVLPTPEGKQSYAVYIRGRSAGWATTWLPVFDKILRTFQTIPPSA
jgi:eukaryotic-like serine/threonine-protein kinase